jgi:hypothetical protein
MESDVVVPALKRTKSEGRAKKKRQKGPKICLFEQNFVELITQRPKQSTIQKSAIEKTG